MMFATVLLLSCGGDPTEFVVVNKTTPYVVVNKTTPASPSANSCPCGASCPCVPDLYGRGTCGGWDCPAATVTPAGTDPRGVWSPVWDGRQWHARWVREEVSQSAAPFGPPGDSFPAATGRATTARSAGTTPTPTPTGSVGTAPSGTPTSTTAPAVVQRVALPSGGTATNCDTGG